MQDAISAAGGFLADANKDGINLARALEDGEQLDIPFAEGTSPVIRTEVPPATEESSSSDLINLNTASQAELETLPGIGPTTAQKIIQYREQNGPFVSTEDIIVYRERVNLALTDLEHMGPVGHDAYLQMTTAENFTPHSRADIDFRGR